MTEKETPVLNGSLDPALEPITVRVACADDVGYSKTITDEMEASAKARGTGIAKRSPDYIAEKICEGKAVIALTTSGAWVGFCYIEAWGHGQFVANSGLIVSPVFRKTGVATQIKKRIFDLSREKYPGAKIFGLTTGLAVMKMNSELGYVPVTYSELTDDEEFWSGCKSCVNFEILTSKERKNCLCTAMLYVPEKKEKLPLASSPGPALADAPKPAATSGTTLTPAANEQVAAQSKVLQTMRERIAKMIRF